MMNAGPPSKGKVVVSGILFWYPLAGVTYQFIHYLIGLRRLGYDVHYVEDSGRWLFNPDTGEYTPSATVNIDKVLPNLQERGLGDCWAFRERYEGGRCHGMSAAKLAELYRDADVFINVTGAQEMLPEHLDIPLRIYVETDPVASQIKVARGEAELCALLDAHHVHFSYGENLGHEDCRVPIERIKWLPTRQPVLIDLWASELPLADTGLYNTIASWVNPGRDFTWQGDTYYWSKDREFIKFLELPRRTSAAFEIATRPDKENRPIFEMNGWRFRDPYAVSRDIHVYRDYITRARGEFTVAKDQNVRLRSGWFSDRSACYLAAGRPVITQETGFSNALPTGRGLFGFRNLDDAAAAVEAIESDYEGNCRTAREIAAEYFSAEKVLANLMGRAGA